MKDEFLATVSHELRTPLNAILGWATILTRGKVDQAGLERAIAAIERNAKSQAKLIEDLLDVSRIISGKLRLDIKPLVVTNVIKAAVDAVRPAADAKQVHLTITSDAGTEELRADEARLQQIIWNLLSNSIKFTPAGGLTHLHVGRYGAAVEISVSDTGEGIDPEFLPFIFERFRQADPSITRKHGGLGLGLAITRVTSQRRPVGWVVIHHGRS
jgi:signal transduction histidine kinase